MDLKTVQQFIWKHKDMILKGKDTYEDCHPLWGTCYPAAYFLWELLDRKGIVMRKKMEHGNHTFVVTDGCLVLDPTADQVPEGFDYLDGAVKQSAMISDAKMPHKMTRKLLELWNQRKQ